ncbi:MAG: HAD family hydrolase [Candidatus Eremiobacteraeota bacterium]|nr:HAD family hydrolase [Candidatus Eremiobacteraeota bacterium]
MIIDIHVLIGDLDREAAQISREAIGEAKISGLDGLVLVAGPSPLPEGFLSALRADVSGLPLVVLGGRQIESHEGALLVLGCNEPLTGSPSAIEISRKVHSCGGAVVLCRGPREHFQGAQAPDLLSHLSPFDGIEVFHDSLRGESLRENLELAHQASLCAVAGSASSIPGRYATKFSVPISSEADLVKALKARQARPCVLEGRDVDPRGGNREKIAWSIPKAHLMKCRGLLFDLYGTLVDLKSFESMDEFNKMAQWLNIEGIGVSGEDLYDFYHRRAKELYASAIQRMSFPEVDILRVFREALHFFSGRDLGREFARKAALVFRALTIRSMRLYPHTRRILRELRRRGYRMGIITNAQAAFTVPEVEDLHLAGFFDFIILSSEAGCSKPERQIYEIALRKLEIPPAETAMIGDDLHGDIHAAKIAGLRTVYLKTNVGTSSFPVEPDVTLTNGDLRNLLRLFP